MSSRLVVVITLIGTALFYSLLLYSLSFVPFTGLLFEHYLYCLLTFVVIITAILLLTLTYYHFYDHYLFLRSSWTKCIIGFLLSFLVFCGWDFLISGVSFHWVVKVVFSLLFMGAFFDDPNSIRSLKREKKENAR